MVKVLLSKRGVVFSIAILLIGLILLSFSTLVFRNHNDNKKDRTIGDSLMISSDLHNSLANVLDTLFEESGVNVTLDSSSISFVETLPNTESVAFRSQLIELESFVDDGRVDLDFDAIKDNLILTGSNISYGHENYGGNELYVNLSSNVTSVVVGITIQENVTSCVFNYDSGSNNLDIVVDGTFGTSCVQSQVVDISGNTLLEVNGMLNVSLIAYSVGVSNGLAGSVNSNVTVSIPNNGVYYYGNPINVTNSFGVGHSGNIRVE